MNNLKCQYHENWLVVKVFLDPSHKSLPIKRLASHIYVGVWACRAQSLNREAPGADFVVLETVSRAVLGSFQGSTLPAIQGGGEPLYLAILSVETLLGEASICMCGSILPTNYQNRGFQPYIPAT